MEILFLVAAISGAAYGAYRLTPKGWIKQKDPNYIRVFFYGMDFLDEELQTQHLFLIKRICRVCGEEKDLVADFYKCRKDSTLESSYSYECKECAKKRTIANYYKKSF